VDFVDELFMDSPKVKLFLRGLLLTNDDT
jgi:hypothetical protein